MACPELRVGSGWESQFAINHLGHFVLVNLLVPAMPANGSRVVAVSSAGHFLSGVRWNDIHFRNGYDRWLAYGQAKTANALFAVQLANSGASRGISAFSVLPGASSLPFNVTSRHRSTISDGRRRMATPCRGSRLLPGRRYNGVGSDGTDTRRSRRRVSPGLQHRGRRAD
ncbi:SDR family NAD(P)-dependent oxidoreductase [Rhodococcus sp. 3Y1]